MGMLGLQAPPQNSSEDIPGFGWDKRVRGRCLQVTGHYAYHGATRMGRAGGAVPPQGRGGGRGGHERALELFFHSLGLCAVISTGWVGAGKQAPRGGGRGSRRKGAVGQRPHGERSEVGSWPEGRRRRAGPGAALLSVACGAMSRGERRQTRNLSAARGSTGEPAPGLGAAAPVLGV